MENEHIVVANQVLWFFSNGKEGYKSGSFHEALFIAFSKADSSNFAKLEEAFPIIGWAVSLYKNSGEDILRTYADSQIEENPKPSKPSETE
jgi:hypothetical protein